MNKYIVLDKSNSNFNNYVEYIKLNICSKFEASWDENQFENILNSENTYTILCFNNELNANNIIGVICFSNIFEQMEILNIFVDKNFRKNGIATILIEKSFEFSKQNNCINCNLEVNVFNTNAINLYTKLGFDNIYTRKGYYANKISNTKDDAYIMTKKL